MFLFWFKGVLNIWHLPRKEKKIVWLVLGKQWVQKVDMHI